MNLLKLWLLQCPEPLIPYFLYQRLCEFQSLNTVQQRAEFAEKGILRRLSAVRLCCVARLVSVCKKIVKEMNDITIIDLSYELSNLIVRNPDIPEIAEWRHLSHHEVDDEKALKVVMDPQSVYKSPLPPSHCTKRAEIAFTTYILSNHVPFLNDRKLVNHGQKLKAPDSTSSNLQQSETELAKMKKSSIDIHKK